MKAFEEWWRNTDFDEEFLDPYCHSKEVWKAALEWAENQFIGKTAFQAEEAINKELRCAKDEYEQV